MFAVQKVALERTARSALQFGMLQVLERPFVMMTPQLLTYDVPVLQAQGQPAESEILVK